MSAIEQGFAPSVFVITFTFMNRIDRLTAILIQLQTKRVVKAEEIAERFEISLRTVYRDVKALMEAGVPIGSEAGKGYFIVDGYHLPPVMFSEEEASAMLTAGKLVEKLTDHSIRTAYESALLKIKSVLNNSEKDHLENLQSSIAVLRMQDPNRTLPNQYMTDIQKAIAKRNVLSISYFSNSKQELTTRHVEPIGVVFYSGAWHLIGWCRLRTGYRDFRTDMIKSLSITDETFDPRNLYTLQQYLKTLTKKHEDMQEVVIDFSQSAACYAKHSRVYYGFVSEESVDDRCRMTFLVGNFNSFCRWLVMFGGEADIVSPYRLREVMGGLVEELVGHYLRSEVG